MKRTFLILGFLITLLLTCSLCKANANQLHTITLEKTNGSYNIILDTDSISKVTKKVISDNEIVLNLSGISSTDTINALYKGNTTIDNLVIENAGLNKLKIYISAANIKSASVLMQPNNGTRTLVGESFPVQKAIWSIFVLTILGYVIKCSIVRTKEENSLLIKRDIKDREIALYKKYKQNIDEEMSLPYKDARLKNMLNKIDRKIDERLSMSAK
jgi:hypothetical protein